MREVHQFQFGQRVEAYVYGKWRPAFIGSRKPYKDGRWFVVYAIDGEDYEDGCSHARLSDRFIKVTENELQLQTA